MITDADLDRVLRRWFDEGPDRAPQDDVAAALRTAAHTSQRVALLPRLPFVGEIAARRGLAILAAALLLAITGLAIALAGGAWRASPTPTVPPLDGEVSETVGLRPVAPVDWAATLAIPPAWAELPGPCCETKVFAGSNPRGQIAVSHGSPFAADVCTPACAPADVAASVPYAPDTQLARLKAAAATAAGLDGEASWGAAPPGTPPELSGAAATEAASVVGGASWRTVVVVGLRDRNVVAITWSQPADAFDQALFHQVLHSLMLPSGPVYTDGDLVESATSRAGFTLPVPALWGSVEQPQSDGRALSGVRRFGDGQVVVSIGSASGSMGWCEPTCRKRSGLTDLDTLEAMVRAGGRVALVEAYVLDGEDARLLRGDPASPVRYAVAMHDGRPVALSIDPTGHDVAPGTVERMLAEFRFVDPEPAWSPSAYEVASGSVSVALPPGWTRSKYRDDTFWRWNTQRLTVRAGSADGSIVTCDQPAGPWERCATVTVASLDELVDEVRFTGVADHGVVSGTRTEDEILVDGERAILLRITAYEHPARGLQEVAYIATWHAGRPYLLRMHTTASALGGVSAVIDGIQFVK